MGLKIIQFNVRSFWGIREPIYQYIVRERPDVVLYNSTGIIDGKTIKHPGYVSRQSPDGAHKGVCIMTKGNQRYEFLREFESDSFMAVKLYTQQGPVIIATAYANPRRGVPLHDLNTLFNMGNIPIFFAGDLNARHRDLFHPNNNPHGRQLTALMEAKRLHYLGPDFDTYFGNDGSRGRPDIAFANMDALPYHCHCRPGPLMGSDHIPMILYISTNPIVVPETPHFNYDGANWEGFVAGLNNAQLDNVCEVQGRPCTTIDIHWVRVLKEIQKQMSEHIPQKVHKIRASFRPSIRTKRLQVCYQNLFSQHRDNIRPINWNLVVLRRHILESYRRDRAEYWKDLVRKTELLRVPAPWDFWKRVRKLKGTLRQPFDFLMDGNRKVKDPDEIVDVLKKHWDNVFQPHPYHPDDEEHINLIENWVIQNRARLAPLHLIDLDILNADSPFTAPITLAEVKDHIAKLKKRAPGGSRISREAVRRLPNSVLRAVVKLYNASLATGYFPRALKTAAIVLILKPGKDPTDPASYRPISLLEILGKIFEGIMNTRLRDHLEDNNLLPAMQFGFRQHRSTEDVTNIMTSYMVNNRDRKLKTVIVTKDIEKAFDRVWHTGMKYKLANNFNLPDLTVRLFCSFLDDRSCYIQFLGRKSSRFTPGAGDPQGSKLSPTFFIMYTADIPRPIRPDSSLTLLYADDCTHMTRSYSANEAIRFMNTELAAVALWERKWRIKTNHDKTNVMIIGKKPRRGFDDVYLNDYDPEPRRGLEKLNEITVLGVNFDKQLFFHKHVGQQLAKAKLAFQLIKRFGSASAPTKRHLYQALVRPHLAFAPLPLSLSAMIRRRDLQVVQNNALRWIWNTKWNDFVTNESLHETTKNVPALNVLWSRQINRQFTKMRAWHEDWIEKLARFARMGRYRIRGARILSEFDYAAPIDPIYRYD